MYCHGEIGDCSEKYIHLIYLLLNDFYTEKHKNILQMITRRFLSACYVLRKSAEKRAQENSLKNVTIQRLHCKSDVHHIGIQDHATVC